MLLYTSARVRVTARLEVAAGALTAAASSPRRPTTCRDSGTPSVGQLRQHQAGVESLTSEVHVPQMIVVHLYRDRQLQNMLWARLGANIPADVLQMALTLVYCW